MFYSVAHPIAVGEILNQGSNNIDPTVDPKAREAALDDFLRVVAFRNGRIAALFLAVFTAVLWPSDLIIFRHIPEVLVSMGWLRVAVLGASLSTWLLLRTRIGPRHPMIILGSGGAIIMAAIGGALGSLGGAEQPWIHLAYPAVFFSVLAPLKLRARAVLVVAIGLALVVGFIAPVPGRIAEPPTQVVMSYVFSLSVMVIAVGHLSFRIMRQSFYQSLALERATRDLAEFNATLELRVRDQTKDLRRLTDHLERAREEERARIARELHDQLGQELTALNLSLALIKQRFAKDPRSIGSNLNELASLLARTRGTTRNLVTELQPQLLDELGLQAAVEWLVNTTEQHSGVRCRLDAGPLDGLASATKTAAFRIVQEALTNVVRHARAKHAQVRLGVQGGALELSVSDDGVGLPPTGDTNGFGLIGIRERVMALSGRLELGSPAGGGTTLRVRLPVEEVRA